MYDLYISVDQNEKHSKKEEDMVIVRYYLNLMTKIVGGILKNHGSVYSVMTYGNSFKICIEHFTNL